ncbi:MAG: sulfur carrier protein ThiS [Prevotella sp.]|nr:sulfur carrier protein ThiS [Prevotella sp.]
MEIKINDKATQTKAATLQELADELSLPVKGVAMAVGNKMVRREEWASTPLTNGSEVIIIKAVCGG